MNCDCIKRTEESLCEFLKAEAGDDVKAECIGTAFQITETSMIDILNIDFRITGSGKGYKSEKGKLMPVRCNYCPFCGVSNTLIVEKITAVPA